MKLLKIEGEAGHFVGQDGVYTSIEKISKEDLIRLTDLTLEADEISFDEFDENVLKNQAHQIIYKSVVNKLQALRERRKSFRDESSRLYLKDYEKYSAQ